MPVMESIAPDLAATNAAIARSFLELLEAEDLDGALVLLDEDVEYINVSLPTVHGRRGVDRLFRPLLGRFEVRDGHITVWRDSFDWMNMMIGLVRGVLGVVLPFACRTWPTGHAARPTSAVGANACCEQRWSRTSRHRSRRQGRLVETLEQVSISLYG